MKYFHHFISLVLTQRYLKEIKKKRNRKRYREISKNEKYFS